MGRFFSWLGDLIQSCVDGIIGFFLAIWDFCWEILCDIGQYFLDCWEYLWDWVQWGYYSAIDWILRQLVDFLDYILNAFPLDIDLSGSSSAVSAMQVANAFFPLGTMFNCITIYLLCLITFVIYKFIKSWIPGISGT